MTKKKAPKVVYTGELAEPVILTVPASDEDIRKARDKRHTKLFALADHYGINILESHGPLALCMALADDHVPGFEIIQRKSGRPKTKTTQHDLAMLVALEMAAERYGERGAKARLSRELADLEVQAEAKRKGRRATKAEIEGRANTIANELSRLDKKGNRLAARVVLDGVMAGKLPEQIAEEMQALLTSLSHQKSSEK